MEAVLLVLHHISSCWYSSFHSFLAWKLLLAALFSSVFSRIKDFGPISACQFSYPLEMLMFLCFIWDKCELLALVGTLAGVAQIGYLRGWESFFYFSNSYNCCYISSFFPEWLTLQLNKKFHTVYLRRGWPCFIGFIFLSSYWNFLKFKMFFL